MVWKEKQVVCDATVIMMFILPYSIQFCFFMNYLCLFSLPFSFLDAIACPTKYKSVPPSAINEGVHFCLRLVLLIVGCFAGS